MALGATNVRVWCPFAVGVDADQSARKPVIAGIAGAAAAAAELGLGVSLEFHPGTMTETAASTMRLLDEVGAPNLFTYWQPAPGADPGHLAAELTTVLPRLSNLHVFWWTATGDRLPLEAGRDAWATLIGLAAGARVALLEFVAGDDPDQFRRDAAVLRALADRP